MKLTILHKTKQLEAIETDGMKDMVVNVSAGTMQKILSLLLDEKIQVKQVEYAPPLIDNVMDE